MLEGYTVHEELYRGRRRVVQRAVRESDRAPVIIKSLLVDIATDQDVAAVKQEFAILSSLSVEGVPRAFGLLSDAHGFHLVLEDRGGSTLADYTRSSPRDLAERLDIAIRIASVLERVHRQHVVHRDINPLNVLVDKKGAVSLIDFSIATQQEEEHQPVSHAGQLQGTLAYMSPEQTGRMNRPVDYRSDFYSLGVTLFELLSGRLPFPADDPTELVYCHMAVPPPRLAEISRDVPSSVSAVVGKLLEKAPADRYQSALGIVNDLRSCREHLHAVPDGFRPGGQDVGDRFSIPRKLYGREAEIRQLLGSFDHASRGGVGLALVAGPPGTGKSALVLAVQAPVTERRSYFISGKFDQLQVNAPYSAVVAAFGELAALLLTESDEALLEWKGKLLDALDGNGRLVIDVIPDVEQVIGPQPPVPELGVAERRNRFKLVFGNFIRVFCQEDRPLVIFLDDLQWVDPASLALIDWLLTDDDSHHLLLIGAYRDTEVEASHPLTATLSALAADEHVRVVELLVGSLTPDSVTHLLQDLLHANGQDVNRLQQLLTEKTAGNPFFLRQFLTTLHRKSQLTFDYARNRWAWNIDELKAMSITDNVVDLMVARLEELPRPTLEATKLAACIGNRFDLATLALIVRDPADDVSEVMRPAVEAGLLLPDRDRPKGPGVPEVPAARTRLRFLHDRVQQAAYAMLDERTKQEVHLQIGQELRSSVRDAVTSDRLFEIVEHLNIGSDLLVERLGRRDLAILNLEAARRAVSATAYVAAGGYLDAGLACLPADAWETDYDLMRDLHRLRVDAEYLRGDFEDSQRTISGMLARLRTPIEQAEVLGALVVQQTLSGRYRPAIETARKALERLGVDLPTGNMEAALRSELDRYRMALGAREPGALLESPDVTSPEVAAALRLLAQVFPPCYIADPPLCRVAAARMVNLSLTHGHTPDSALGYAFFGFLSSSVLHEYREAYSLGRLAMALADKYSDASQVCKSTHMFCAFINHWKQHLREFDEVNRWGFQAGLQSGELQYAGYHRYNRALCLFHLGTNLKELVPELGELTRFGRKTRNQHATDPIEAVMRAALDLAGDTPEPGSFVSEGLGDQEFLDDLASRDARPATCHYNVVKSQVLYLYGRIEDADRHAELAAADLSYILGHVSQAVHTFYAALIAVAGARRAPGGATPERVERMRRWQVQLREWAESCPENFLHKSLLVDAELTSLEGDGWQAAELYDQAIQEAGRSGYLQEEALARERAGLFWLGQDRRKIAALYLNEAHHGYRLWGASRKAAMLADEHRGLIAGTPAARRPETATSMPFFTLVSSTGTALDFATVMKASRAISEEVTLDALVKKLVRIAVEAAGAQRGYLLLLKDGSFLAEASSTFDQGEARYVPSIPIDAAGVPASIVNYVARTKATLVITDAGEDARFAGDAVVRRMRPRSVLCVPIMKRGDTVSLLYLDHALASGAFTPDRVEILQSLAAQAAVSLENARLYEEQKTTADELREALQELQRLKNQLEAENLYLQEEIKLDHGEILGESPAIKKVLKAIEAVAQTDVTVIVAGETGTGKELVARALHTLSPRKHKPLIKVNCASIPKELFESEFFGHVKGAFTGALRDRTGRFELADKGTLFLDEVGEIPLDMQSKLLRVLQEGEFERVGEERTRKVDVRILSATNRDLRQEAQAGRFRQDLYYRLSVFPIEVAPLRERQEDIPRLAAHYLQQAAVKLKLPLPNLTEANVLRLQSYDWPGNVRELQNIIERAVIVSGLGPLQLDLPATTVGKPSTAPPAAAGGPVPQVIGEDEKRQRDRENVLAALEKAHWKIGGKRGAAELLGVKPSTLASRIKKLGLARGE